MSRISLMKVTVLLLLAFPVSAQYMFEVYQDTWVDGPGYPGPHVSEFSWGEGFDTCSAVDWFSSPGELQSGVGYLSQPDTTVIRSYLVANQMCIVDIDDDGDSDAAYTTIDSSYRLTVVNNTQGTGLEWEADTVAFLVDDASFLEHGDFNGDGLPDLVLAIWSTGDVIWFENPGSAAVWPEHTVINGLDGPGEARTCDIDEDGDIDILVASDDGVLLFFNSNGLGTSWDLQQLEASGNCRDISIDDIDGDGDIDIASLHAGSASVRWWDNQGGSTWIEHTIGDLFSPHSIQTADLDNDGDIDIAASGYDQLNAWYNEGAGDNWTAEVLDEEFTARDLNAADADGDGDMDLMGSYYTDIPMVHIWEQTFEGLVHHGLFVGGEALVSRFSDMDGDGVCDITTAWEDPSNSIAWYEYTSYAVFGWLESTVLELMMPTDSPFVEWGILQWSAETPSGTAVMFQVRAGMEYYDLGEWTDYITSPGTLLQGLLDDEALYVQYRASLVSTDPDTFPSLDQMMLSYTPLGGGVEEEDGKEPGLYAHGANPCRGLPVLECIIGQSGAVHLRIWDMAGRLVSNPLNGTELNAGSHLVQLGELRSGIYFCRLTSRTLEETLRLVVLE